ncbi:MAG: hypothetical protein JWM35_2605 [Verrucomicrobia bacterium]|nr:hypothetical protein [Verrucomicrobiota bacterium]
MTWEGGNLKILSNASSSRRLAAVICFSVFGLCSMLAGADKPAPLVPGVSIEIPNSKGKFDFLEVDPSMHRLLGAHEEDGTVDVIDLDTNKVLSRINIGGATVDVAVDPKTQKYFVSAQEGNRVAVVSAKTLKETNSIKMAGDLDGILFNPKNRCVYVGNDEGTHLWVINADTEKLVGDVTIPGAPEYMVYDEANDKIYLNIKVTDEIVAIDPAKGVVIAHWSTAPATKPHGLAFDPASGRLFAAGANGFLVTVDIKTGKVIGKAEIAEKVDQATFDPYTRRIYCAAPGWLSVVQETDSGTEFLGNVKTAATAKNVKVDPKTHAVWTTYTDGKNSYARSWTPVK